MYISDSMDEFRLSVRNLVVSIWSNFLWRVLTFAISWTPFSYQSYRISVESLIRSLLYCCLLAEPTSLSKKKNKKFEKNMALEIAPDQTQLRLKTFLISPRCARGGYDWTQLRSKSPLIRPKCARIRLWSDFSDQKYLWSDHLQTIVQTVVRSNFRPDPVISVWEHTGVRSTGSDHKPIWIWPSTSDSPPTVQIYQDVKRREINFDWSSTIELMQPEPSIFSSTVAMIFLISRESVPKLFFLLMDVCWR